MWAMPSHGSASNFQDIHCQLELGYTDARLDTSSAVSQEPCCTGHHSGHQSERHRSDAPVGKPSLLFCRPFLLQSRASYTQIGIFSVASYPYSFKLLWSPIVDSIYSLAFGRRKSWVVPIQFGSSIILLVSAKWLAGRWGPPVSFFV